MCFHSDSETTTKYKDISLYKNVKQQKKINLLILEVNLWRVVYFRFNLFLFLIYFFFPSLQFSIGMNVDMFWPLGGSTEKQTFQLKVDQFDQLDQ